jgi:nuclear GTP-binding protein
MNVKKNILDTLEKKKQTSSREDLIQSLKDKLEKNNVCEYDNMNSYGLDAESKKQLYDGENDSNIIDDNTNLRLNRENKDQSKRAFIKDLREVIENSDVILEVLDARDPLSCKSQELEELIRSHKDEKKIIIIINKIDLIPL